MNQETHIKPIKTQRERKELKEKKAKFNKSILDIAIKNSGIEKQVQKRRKRRKNLNEPFTEKREKIEYQCSVCNTIFLKKEILQSHFIRKHTEGYNFSCEDCGKQFKIKGDLTTHRRLHHLEPPTVCDVCGKTYKNSLSLYVHQKYAHYKARFECPICKRCMVTQENLDNHIEVMHKQNEKLICDECGKMFTKKVNLRRHIINVHTDIKSFKCPVCSKAFSQRYHLRQHLLLHTGQRLFICDICGKQFAQKPGLLSHRKIHPGEHPPLPIIRLDHVLKDLLNK